MRALLDINVLIALLDAGHIQHNRTMNWLSGELEHGWASCPITQNGCIRILSQPAYPGSLPAAAVAERLQEATRHSAHEFWAYDISLLDENFITWQRITGHRQITDAYLLAIAVQHHGRFVTFDARLTCNLVKNASLENLLILS